MLADSWATSLIGPLNKITGHTDKWTLIGHYTYLVGNWQHCTAGSLRGEALAGTLHSVGYFHGLVTTQSGEPYSHQVWRWPKSNNGASLLTKLWGANSVVIVHKQTEIFPHIGTGSQKITYFKFVIKCFYYLLLTYWTAAPLVLTLLITDVFCYPLVYVMSVKCMC